MDYWTLNGMPTINNEIFFLSLYQVYYYYLYLVKLLPSTQTTCTHTLSLNFLIFTTNTLTKQENIFIKFSNCTYLYILTQRKPLRFIDCQQQLRFQHFTAWIFRQLQQIKTRRCYWQTVAVVINSNLLQTKFWI